MNKSPSFKLISKFYINLIFKNKSLLSLIIFNVITIIAIPNFIIGFLGNYNKTFNEISLAILGLPIILLIAYISLAVVIIFIKTKRNNMDLYLYIKPISNFKIILAKQYAISILAIHIILAYFISSLVLLAFNIPLLLLLISFFGILISVLLIGFIWLSFTILISIFFKFFTSLAFVSISTFSLILLTVLPFITQQSNILQTDYDSIKNKNNFLKIYSIDKNGALQDKEYAVYSNPSGQKNNIISGWKPNKIVSYSPFNGFFGITPAITKKILSKKLTKNELLTTNNRWSSTYLQTTFRLLNFKKFLGNHKSVYGINDKTIFDSKNKNNIFKSIHENLEKSNEINNKIGDSNFWSSFKKELVNQNIWNSNLSTNKKEIILHLAGLKSDSSYLYSIFNEYDLITNKINGIYIYLENRYSKEFADFVKYIWTNKNVRLNIYSYNTIANYKELERYYPSIMSYDDLSKANDYDIEFIKNKLFYLITDSRNNIQKIKMLNSSRIYEDLSDNNIFSAKITTRDDFYNYINQNNTINNLLNLISHESTKMKSQPYKMSFRNNVPNYLILNNSIDISESSSIKLSLMYLGIFGFLAILAQLAVKHKISKGDLL